MTDFFGERWNVPIVDHAQHAPTQSACLAISVNVPIRRGDQGFIRPLITEHGPAGNLPVHRGCDMAVTIGHLFGICSCTGWEDIYERGQELARRDDAGILKVDEPAASP
jgi:hypothetical protein